jgi:hypothetical protein
MRIVCPNGAGVRPVVQVSPDFVMDHRDEFVERAIIVRYVLDGDIVDKFRLSPEFAKAHDVVAGDHELPDEYPLWIKEIQMICSHCFDARLKSPGQ